MEISKFDKMSDEALVHQELQLERDLLGVNFRHRTSQLDDMSQMKKLRRDIARARTIQRSREMAQGLAKNALRDQHRNSFKPGAKIETGEDSGDGFLKGIAGKLGLGNSEEDQD